MLHPLVSLKTHTEDCDGPIAAGRLVDTKKYRPLVTFICENSRASVQSYRIFKYTLIGAHAVSCMDSFNISTTYGKRTMLELIEYYSKNQPPVGDPHNLQ